MLYITLPIIFVIGLVFVAMEDRTKINKAAVVIGVAIAMWTIVLNNIDMLVGHIPQVANQPYYSTMSELDATERFVTEILLIHKLGDVSTTLFFVLSTMVIIELLDKNGAFVVVTESITNRNKRKLLWTIAILAFFISALLDNIAAAVVIVALLRKLVYIKEDRWIYACTTIIAANAGGSWSPIGDVTTILLWSSGNVSALHQIASLILPSATTLVLSTLLAQRFFAKDETLLPLEQSTHKLPKAHRIYSLVLLIMGVVSLVSVPVFTEVTGLPPFMGVMLGLTVLWIYTDLVFGRDDVSEHHKMSVVKMFSQIDMATVMFFFGVLMSVAAMDTAGVLDYAGEVVSDSISNPLWISFIVGVCSSFVDNVALVAATMGMYPLADSAATGALANYVADSDFWTFLAYCGVTGGSILIIGSATGVTVMGMEKISFAYYLKRFSLIAFVGYVGGAICFLLLN